MFEMSVRVLPVYTILPKLECSSNLKRSIDVYATQDGWKGYRFVDSRELVEDGLILICFLLHRTNHVFVVKNRLF